MAAWNSLSSGKTVLPGICGRPLPMLVGQIGTPTAALAEVLPVPWQ